MTKLIFFFDSDVLFNNWRFSNTIHEIFLDQRFVSSLLFSQNVSLSTLKYCKQNGFDYRVIELKQKPRIFSMLEVASLIYHRKKSSSFEFRLKRFLFGFASSSIKQKLFALIKIRNLKIVFFYFPLFSFLGRYILIKSFRVWTPTRDLESMLSSDIVIFPSSVNEYFLQPFFHVLQKKGKMSILVTDNWDNISSKNILLIKPHKITVFGQQTRNHAINIQNFDINAIWELGTPRFNQYIKSSSSQKLNARERGMLGKYRAIYLGSFLPHAELYLIARLLRIFSNEVEFSYKPHPEKVNRYFDLSDNDISIKGLNFLTSNINLCKNKSLLDNYDIVISTPTTMAIESLLNSNYTIIDGTNDGFHSTTAFNSLNEYTHLKDLKLISNLDIAYNFIDLEQFVYTKLNETKNFKIEYNLSYFYTSSETSFWGRLSSNLLDLRKK